MSTDAADATTTAPSRREELLSIAAAVFAEKGFEGSTIREIADRAGILSGSLYHHFESKEEMAAEVTRRYWDDLEEANRRAVASSDDPAEQLRALVHASVNTSLRRQDEVRILHQDWHYIQAFGNLDSQFRSVQQTWHEVIDAGVHAGQFRRDLNPGMVYLTIMGALAWFPRWFRPEGPLEPESIAQMQADLFLEGLTA